MSTVPLRDKAEILNSGNGPTSDINKFIPNPALPLDVSSHQTADREFARKHKKKKKYFQLGNEHILI